MKKKQIMIIDNNVDTIRIISDLLESEGHSVSTAVDPVEGLRKLRENPPDLLLLEIRLPKKEGFEVYKEIKTDPKIQNVPIIIISARSKETDVVVGLEMGAEDYITKPFRKLELAARVKLVLRRADAPPAPHRFWIGEIQLDFGRYSAEVRGKPIVLTPKEFELLGFFMKMYGRVLTRTSISNAVWGTEYTGSSRTIDVHVDQLRKKLGRCGDYIKTLKGIGYRFEAEEIKKQTSLTDR